MNTFEFSHPEIPNPERLAGLSEDARSSLSNKFPNQGPADPLIFPERYHNENDRAEVNKWAHDELNDIIAFTKIGTVFYEKGNSPLAFEDLYQNNPNLDSTLSRLYEAKLALTDSNEVIPDGIINVGKCMHLILMPWHAYINNLKHFNSWLKNARKINGQSEDQIDMHINDVIQHDLPIYRNPNNPKDQLTLSQYLENKIATDGPWGVLLAQTSRDPGTKTLHDKTNEFSVSDLNLTGADHFEVNNIAVDAMGLFEWLSLTFQYSHSSQPSNIYSLLLANQLDLDIFELGDQVLHGNWTRSNKIITLLGSSNFKTEFLLPRLAVQ